jgi:hypothetical protein
MARRLYRPPKQDTFQPGEGFKELERTFRALSKRQEDHNLKRATREALDALWRRKGVAVGSNTERRSAVRRITYS